MDIHENSESQKGAETECPDRDRRTGGLRMVRHDDGGISAHVVPAEADVVFDPVVRPGKPRAAALDGSQFHRRNVLKREFLVHCWNSLIRCLPFLESCRLAEGVASRTAKWVSRTRPGARARP